MQENTINKIVATINTAIQNQDIYGASYSLIGKNVNLRMFGM